MAYSSGMPATRVRVGRGAIHPLLRSELRTVAIQLVQNSVLQTSRETTRCNQAYGTSQNKHIRNIFLQQSTIKSTAPLVWTNGCLLQCMLQHDARKEGGG